MRRWNRRYKWGNFTATLLKVDQTTGDFEVQPEITSMASSGTVQAEHIQFRVSHPIRNI